MMKVLIAYVMLFAGTHILAQSNRTQCFVEGECIESQQVGLSIQVDEEECLKFCQVSTVNMKKDIVVRNIQCLQFQDDPDCTWFTYYVDNMVCEGLAECTKLVDNSAFVSGESDCPDLACRLQGRCEGDIHNVTQAESYQDCQEQCRSLQDCEWYTYYVESSTCFTYADCPTLDETCIPCMTGQRGCRPEPGILSFKQ